MNSDRTPSLSFRLRHVFSDHSQHSSRLRSRLGVLVAMVLIPLLLGVLACMPVPVGDPEKSRVDPAISGIWLSSLEADAPLMIFDPFDKRTWLVSMFELKEEQPVASGQADSASSDNDERATSVINLSQQHQYTIEEFVLCKGWLTPIGDGRFLTLEEKNFDPGSEPGHWWVFRVKVVAEDQIQLVALNAGFNGLEDIETSEEAEKVIRQNLENPELYGDTLDYRRASQGELGVVDQLLEAFGVSSGT